MTEEYEYLGVPDYAKRVGKTPQHIYNLIKAGELDTITFKRGQYNGLLIKLPRQVKNE
jgi:predicted DNA-binding transcriptional regulator AlpA